MTPDLDIEDFSALEHYLAGRGELQAGEEAGFSKLAGGVSNRTVLVKRKNAGSMVVKQALRKLRVAVDWFGDPERIHVEARALRWLPQLAPPRTTPAFLFEDFEHHLLAMQAVPDGHQDWKKPLLQGNVVPEHFTAFGELIGTIHRNSFEHPELEREFADRSVFESLRLEPYYLYSASQVPEASAFLRSLVDETRQCRATLVHGDYSPKNILLSQGSLVLLDCEVVHFGDPAFDLGFSLTHFLSKAHRDRTRRSGFLSATRLYWESYRHALQDSPMELGRAPELEPRVVRHTLACLLARVAGRSPLEYLDAGHRRSRA
jgi:tRNA A-37 threonylcarbamoyl transferase component Bud32